MTIIQLIFLISCCNRSITAIPSNPNGLIVSRADSFSIYKKWELDTILGKEATLFGGIQDFQVLDLRDSTVLKMHPFGTDGPPTRYTIVGNEIVLLDKKGIPFKAKETIKRIYSNH